LAKQLRIIAGKFRGKKLHSVPGILTRPTADRVREAIFNILGSEVMGAVVLDLFSGTGVLGIEALSRGARYAVFVDNHPLPLSVIQKYIAECLLGESTRIVRRDLRQTMDRAFSPGMKFNLVLMDPPYNQGLIGSTLDRLHASGILEKEAVIMAEHTLMEPIPEPVAPFVLQDQRKYGKTQVSFLIYGI
jgi:16S rRNA (guanine966-N2)-methyltransferase